jgi:hypothetical protein
LGQNGGNGDGAADLSMNGTPGSALPRPKWRAWTRIPLGIAAVGVLAFVVVVGGWVFLWCKDLPLHPPPSLPASAVSRIPLVGVDSDRIYMTQVDEALTADGRAHVLWRTFDDPHDRRLCWYARSDRSGMSWSSPQLVDSSVTTARLVAASSGLHAFVRARTLRHLVAGKIPGSWSEEGPIGRAHEPPSAFDVATIDSEIIVAYVTWSSPDTEADFADKTARLVVADIRANGRVAYHDIANFGHLEEFQVGGPKLVRFRGGVHVVIAVVGSLDTLRLAPGERPPSGARQTGEGAPWVVDKIRLLEAHRDSTDGAWSTLL